jgi:hypothetical protein
LFMVGTKPLVIAAAGLVIAATLAGVLGAQPPMLRRHTATSTRPLALVPADRQPPAANRVSITVEGDDRVIRCNDMPSHRVGAFPNRGNPHSIAEQTTEVRLPAQPQVASAATMLHDPSRR